MKTIAASKKRISLRIPVQNVPHKAIIGTMSHFREKVRRRGYMLRELRARWKISARQMSRISKRPKQIHLDALAGLPAKVKKPGRITTVIRKR